MDIKTKYDLKDTVWYLNGNKINSSEIEALNIKLADNETPIQIRYRVIGNGQSPMKDQFWVMEYNLFPTKTDLLNHLSNQ